MGLFLKYIFKNFLIVALLVCLISTIGFLIVHSSQFFLSDYGLYSYEDYEVGFFGHSEMKDAVDEERLNFELNKMTKNFSVRGAPLYFTSKLIDYSLSKKKLTVVVNLSRNNVDYRGSLKDLYSEPSKTYYYSKFFYYHSLYEYPFFKSFLNSILDLSQRIIPFIHFKKGDKQEIKINEAIKRFKQDSTYINRKWKSNMVDIDYEINEFDELIKSYPKIKFILITTPEYRMNKLLFNNDHRFFEVIKRLIENNNVIYLDYSDCFLEEKYFRDFNHLSFIGKELFSKILSRDLSFILD